MRQGITVVSIFLLLLALLYLFIPEFTRRTVPEAFLAQNTLIILQQKNLQKKISAFKNSPLGKSLQNIDFYNIAEDLGVAKTDTKPFKDAQNSLEQAFSDPLLNILIGREVTLALLPFEQSTTTPYAEQLIENIVIISRPKFSVKISDLAIKFGSQSIQAEQARYGGYIINRFFSHDKRHFYVVGVKDLILASMNERLLRRCLDLYDEGNASLINDEYYRKTRTELASSSLYCYLNFKNLPRYIREFRYLPLPEQSRNLFKMELPQGYKKGFIGVWQENKMIYDKAIVYFDKQHLPANLKRYAKRKPEETSSFKRLGQDTIWYYWTNCFSPEKLLAMLEKRENSSGPAAGADILTQLANITGLSNDEMVGLFASELTVAMKGISERQFVPIPLFMFVFKSPDPARLQSSVEKIIAHYKVPVHRQTIGGVEIISWGGIIGMGSIVPTIAFVDDKMLLASNQKQIKEFIRLVDGKNGMDSSKLFKSVNGKILKKNNTVIFMRFAEITRLLKELVSWGGTMLAIEDRETAKKSKILIDRLINPILDGMAMYSVIGSRKYIEEDRIILESTTITDNGN